MTQTPNIAASNTVILLTITRKYPTKNNGINCFFPITNNVNANPNAGSKPPATLNPSVNHVGTEFMKFCTASAQYIFAKNGTGNLMKKLKIVGSTTLQITIPFAFPSSAYLSPICTNTTLTVFLI